MNGLLLLESSILCVLSVNENIAARVPLIKTEGKKLVVGDC